MSKMVLCGFKEVKEDQSVMQVARDWAWKIMGKDNAKIATDYFRTMDEKTVILIYNDIQDNSFHAFESYKGDTVFHTRIGDKENFSLFISKCYGVDFKHGESSGMFINVPTEEHLKAIDKAFDLFVPF